MDQRAALAKEIEGFPVDAAYLFGSQVGGDASPTSDVDLALILDEEVDATERSRIRDTLSLRAAAIFGTDTADVVLLDDAPPGLAFEAIDGELLVDREPRRRETLEARILSAYHDRRFYEERWERETLDRFREEGFA